MKPLETIYWLRIASGITAALLCVIYGKIASNIPSNLTANNFPVDFPFFLNSLSLAIITYIISYYLIKSRFILKVEKPKKIFTTGIGIYFISWLVFWALLYTIIAGPPV